MSTPVSAEVVIAAFGDSLTQGYGLPVEEGFVPQLEAWLAENGAEDVRLLNAGVSGDTTAGGLQRIGWTLTDEVDAVMVTLGGNDLLRGLSPAEMRSNLDGIMGQIAAKDLPILLSGMPAPVNYGAEYRDAVRSLYPELAEKYDALFFRNFLAGLSGQNLFRLMQDDGIHPNAEGVALIVEEIGPQVKALADRARE
ncbi:arylesterase [Paracoccaceae bacterium GXU_MW_L88]